ncbi:unnamed protein product [Cochlearia groenlandica]
MGKSTTETTATTSRICVVVVVESEKPQFRPAADDTKPILHDPIVRSDPMETEEALLRLPPLFIPTHTPPFITKPSTTTTKVYKSFVNV